MSKILLRGARSGSVMAPPSKSELHRLLILAAQGQETSILADCFPLSDDIKATVRVLNALGADIEENEEEGELIIEPIHPERVPESIEASCGESGATLRFMMPLIGSYGVKARLTREGRLARRPVWDFAEVLEAHGMRIEEDGRDILLEGQLESGDYAVSGELSSQYISGLLMTLPFMPGNSNLKVLGEPVSVPYIDMTEKALKDAYVVVLHLFDNYFIPGRQMPALPSYVGAEGDYSGASAFLCMGALSEGGIRVEGLNEASVQADRAVIDALKAFGADVEETEEAISVSGRKLKAIRQDMTNCPDLLPYLSVMAAAAEGESRFEKIGRLKYKESDRLKAVCDMVNRLGAQASVQKEELVIKGLGASGKALFRGGAYSSYGDHRMAMALACAAAAASEDIILDDEGCVDKSYVNFWSDYDSLERNI